MPEIHSLKGKNRLIFWQNENDGSEMLNVLLQIPTHRNPTVQKEAIWPIESAPTTIPPRPYPHIPTHLPANPSNLRISGH